MSTLTELFNTPTALSHKRDSILAAIHVTSFTLGETPEGEAATYSLVADGESITLGNDPLEYNLGYALLQQVTGTSSNSHQEGVGFTWALDNMATMLADNKIEIRPIIHLRSPATTNELIKRVLNYPANILITHVTGKVDPITKHVLFWIDTNNGMDIAVNTHHTHKELSRQLCNYQLDEVDADGFYTQQVSLILTVYDKSKHSISMVTPAN